MKLKLFLTLYYLQGVSCYDIYKQYELQHLFCKRNHVNLKCKAIIV